MLSSKPLDPVQDIHAETSKGSWWSRIKTAVFPVGETKATADAVSSKQQKAMALMSPASLQRLQRIKDAEERQHSLASTGDVFTPLSKGAEEFSGNLFKAGMFMISLPLAGENGISADHIQTII